MSIVTATPPTEMNDIAASGFTALRRAKNIQSADSEAGGGAIARLHKPLAIYHLDSKELVEIEAAAKNAKQIGWKYLVKQGVSAETVEIIGSTVSAIGHGRIASILIHTLDVAEKSVPKSSRYEARILTFGREGNSLLWLHSVQSADKFFSLSDSPTELVGAEVFRSVARAAQVRGLFRDRSRATGERLLDDDESGG